MRAVIYSILILFLTCTVSNAVTSLESSDPIDDLSCSPELIKSVEQDANLGDADAQFHLGLFHISGTCQQKNISLAVSLISQAASKGHVEAATFLGKLYAQGTIVGGNVATSNQYFLIAAELGQVEAQHWLGLQMIIDAQSDDDRFVGLAWLGRAAFQGDGFTAAILGMLHQRGMHGISPDHCIALDWYEVAHSMGFNDTVRPYRALKSSKGKNC